MPVCYLTHRIRIGYTRNDSKFSQFKNNHGYKNYKKPQKKLFSLAFMLILLFILLKCDSTCLKSKSSSGHDIYIQKHRNREQHSKNGNVQNNKSKKCKNIKLLHLNKRNSNFKNRIAEMQLIITKYNPDIITIAEANIDQSYTDYISQFENYNIELNKMFQICGNSRNAIFIKKKQLAYKRREDLEDYDTCTIWIKIIIQRTKKVLLMGGYRQWNLPKTMDPDNNTNSGIQQMNRLQKILAKWALAMNENKDVVVMMDDNIDSDINSTHNKIYKIKNLYDLWQSHLIDFNIHQHNNLYTWFHRTQKPSTIDHIFSNCPNKISEVKTIRNSFSDHAMLLTEYMSSDIVYRPKFIKIRKSKLLSKRNLQTQFKNNDILPTIFNYTDPNQIADILQIELNSMIELIAPQSYIQYTKDYAPYIDESLHEDIKNTDDLLTKAIKSKNPNDWTNFKNSRNITQKKLKNKKNYFWKVNFHQILTNGNWSKLIMVPSNSLLQTGYF